MYASSEQRLTPRMCDVLRAGAAGAGVRKTAGELHLSESTVRHIRAAAMQRLDVPTWPAAIARAFQRGAL